MARDFDDTPEQAVLLKAFERERDEEMREVIRAEGEEGNEREDFIHANGGANAHLPDSYRSGIREYDDERDQHDHPHDVRSTNTHKNEQHSFRLRLLLLLRSIVGLTWLRAIPATTRRLGVRGTVRSVFNYIEPESQPRSTAWLDGLRGLAAFEVFIFHYNDGWVDRTLAWGHEEHMSTAWYYLPFIRTIYASGDSAVCLFFAISGYVLSYRMLRLMRQQRYEELLQGLSSAVFRRAIRLYTPVLVETFALMVLCRWFNLPKPVHYEAAPTFGAELASWFKSFGHLLLPLRYPDRWDQIQDRYDGGISWTIPLEYYGSLYVYMIVLLVSRTGSIVIRRCLIFGLVMLSFGKDDWIAAQFLMGMAFADYQLEREERVNLPKDATRPAGGRWSRIRPAFFFGLFLFGFYLSGMPGGYMYSEYEGDIRVKPRPFFDWFVQPIAWTGVYPDRQMDRNILCFATMCSIAGIGETPVLKKLLETRPVQYLGRISFGLYLCHIFLRAWMQPWHDASLLMFGYDLETSWKDRAGGLRLMCAYLVMMVPSTVLNLIVGGLFERYLDKPSVYAGKTFEKWCLSFGTGADPIRPFTSS